MPLRTDQGHRQPTTLMTRTLLLALLLPLAACADGAADASAGSETSVPTPDDLASVRMGDTVPDGEALTPDELIAGANDYAGQTVVVEGVAREVCQQKGCWLTLADDQGRTVRVNVPRDESDTYVYTFPMDASGQTVRLAGRLAVETESVEDQRHYATDGGASADEVEAITEPKQTLVFTALGAEVVRPSDTQGA